MLNCPVPFLVVKYKPLCAKLERSLAAKLTCKGLSRATCIFEKNTTYMYIDEVMTAVAAKVLAYWHYFLNFSKTTGASELGYSSRPR